MHCEQLESPKGMCRASASSDLVFSRTALQVAVQSSFFVKPLVVKYPMRKWMVQGPIKQNAYRLWMIMIDVNHSKILETPVLMTRFSSRLKSPRPGSMQLATHLHHPFHAVFCGRRRHGDQSRLQHLGPQIFGGKTRKAQRTFWSNCPQNPPSVTFFALFCWYLLDGTDFRTFGWYVYRGFLEIRLRTNHQSRFGWSWSSLTQWSRNWAECFWTASACAQVIQ